jgi:hypothetical protein
MLAGAQNCSGVPYDFNMLVDGYKTLLDVGDRILGYN